MIYVVGNEQNHHFDVLFKTLDKMDYKWANDLFHLSYGMVNLPDGKMKSREGKVIDIDNSCLPIIKCGNFAIKLVETEPKLVVLKGMYL